MYFDFDGKKLTVSGKSLSVQTANGSTVITEAEPKTTEAAAASTGAKRGRKSNAEKAAAAGGQTSFNPEQLPAQ